MNDDQKARLLRWTVVAVFAAESLLFIKWIPDDAFISFHYASNRADGAGMVFNAGERVEGMSNPLWTAALAIFTAAGADTVWAAVTLSEDVGSKRYLRLKSLLSIALVVSMPMAFYATSGMETHAELALLLAGAVLQLEARSRGGAPRQLAASQAAFLGVALLRPEGILFLLVGSVFTSVALRGSPRRWGWVLVAAPLAIYAVVYARRAAYYGAALPNTYLAEPGAQIG
jgi:hypothetical protein